MYLNYYKTEVNDEIDNNLSGLSSVRTRIAYRQNMHLVAYLTKYLLLSTHYIFLIENN